MFVQTDTGSLLSEVLLADDYLQEATYPNTPSDEAKIYHEAWKTLCTEYSVLDEEGWKVCVLGQPENVWHSLGEGVRGLALSQGWNLRWVIVRDDDPGRQPKVEWMKRYRDLLVEKKRESNTVEIEKQGERLDVLSDGYAAVYWVEPDSDPSDCEDAVWEKANGGERRSFWGNSDRPHSVYWSGKAEVSYASLLEDKKFDAVRKGLRGKRRSAKEKSELALDHLVRIALSRVQEDTNSFATTGAPSHSTTV